jgi:predicted DNA-binding protein with PD1-like motif
MRSVRLSGSGERGTHILVMEAGDEPLGELERWARAHEVTAARITAVGAFRDATLGWYDLEQQSYREIAVTQQVEVLSFLGDVALGEDGAPAIHVHVVVGMADGATRGGHLLRATVRPTLEVVVDEAPVELRKRFVPEFGLALIRP